jgi:CRISPR-associated protein Cas2
MPRPAAMRYLFAYDLPSTRTGNRRRARLARHLESLGLRVQGSVFELELAPEILPRILDDLNALLEATQDSLRVYTLCAACQQRSLTFGLTAPCEHGPVFYF